MFVSVLFLILLSSLIPISTGMRVTSTQPYQHIMPGEGYQVMCNADLPLIGCQMMDQHSNTFYKLSDRYEASFSKKYHYVGDGLAHGHCGINVPTTELKEFIALVVCRVRASGSRWMHAVSVIEATEAAVTLFPVECDEETMIVSKGNRAVFEFYATDTIESCKFKWSGLDFDENWLVGEGNGYRIEIQEEDDISGGRSCRLVLENLSPESSGFVVVKMEGSKNKNNETPIKVCVTTLIVIDPPDKPKMSRDDNTMAGPLCEVGPSRPSPILVWLDGKKMIRADNDDDLDTGKHWVWEYEPQSVTQMLNARLMEELAGRSVTCRVGHIGLMNANKTLDSEMRLLQVSDWNYSNMLISIVYVMIGVCTVMLATAIIVALISIYRYTTRTWCFIGMEA